MPEERFRLTLVVYVPCVVHSEVTLEKKFVRSQTGYAYVSTSIILHPI